MRFALGISALFSLCAAAPALAQTTDTLPRFYALEQQQLDLEQNRLDSLERQRQDERAQNLAPNSGVTAADSALRDLDFQRERDRLLLEGEQQRAQVARERQIEDAALPNRRVAAYSSVVIKDPERYVLPPAPKGYYYARVDGRFVLVDGASELVVKVLEPQPTDPTNDLPAGPLPPTQRPLGSRGLPGAPSQQPQLATRIGPEWPVERIPETPPARSGPPLPKQQPLPAELIGPNSPYVVREPAKLNLPAPPSGNYYANIGGRILLVDARTQKAIALIRAGAPG